jgi:hypothetical protein
MIRTVGVALLEEVTDTGAISLIVEAPGRDSCARVHERDVRI